MKLFVLFNKYNDKIIAISEQKDLIYKYILQKNMMTNFRIIKITDDKTIDKFLIVYDELVLEEVEGFALTYVERKFINRAIDEEKSNIQETIRYLKGFLRNYNFKDKEYLNIQKTIKILSKNIKPKRINTLIKIKECISSLFSLKNKNIIDYYINEINKKDSKYYIHINE